MHWYTENKKKYFIFIYLKNGIWYIGIFKNKNCGKSIVSYPKFKWYLISIGIQPGVKLIYMIFYQTDLFQFFFVFKNKPPRKYIFLNAKHF